MLLMAAIAWLGVVVAAGAWLARCYLLTDDPPSGLPWQGVAHGTGGLAGFALLVAALRDPARTFGSGAAHAARMGAGAFGYVAGALIAGTLLGGIVILLTQLRRRPVSTGLVAAHGMLGITGYTLLVTYMTMLR